MGRVRVLFLWLFVVAAYADNYTTSVGKTESVGPTESVGKTESVGTLDPLGNSKPNNQKAPDKAPPATAAPKKSGVPTIDITGNPSFIDVRPSGTSKKNSSTPGISSSDSASGNFQVPGGHQDSGNGGEEFDPGAFYGQGLDAGANFPAGAFDGSGIEGISELGSVVVEASKKEIKENQQDAPQGYMMMRGPDDGSPGDPSEMNPAMVPGGSAGC